MQLYILIVVRFTDSFSFNAVNKSSINVNLDLDIIFTLYLLNEFIFSKQSDGKRASTFSIPVPLGFGANCLNMASVRSGLALPFRVRRLSRCPPRRFVSDFQRIR
jgi:hypothetical protein